MARDAVKGQRADRVAGAGARIFGLTRGSARGSLAFKTLRFSSFINTAFYFFLQLFFFFFSVSLFLEREALASL